MSPTKQDDETAKESITPDFLKGIDISPEEEKEMENAAYNGAADDIAEGEGLSGDDLRTAEESGSSTPKKAKSEKQELDQIGSGYNEEDTPSRGKRLVNRFKGSSNKKKAGLIASLFGGLGLVGAMAAMLFNLVGIFRLDNFLNAVEAKAFIRYQVDMEGRSSKWINAYVTLRFFEVDDPHLAPGDKDNLYFRANRVDTNSPTRDWYKTMRASKFEADLAEKQGIRITSIASRVNGKIVFRPGVVTLNNKQLAFDNLSNADRAKLTKLAETFDTGDFDINQWNGIMHHGLEGSPFENDKEGRKAIKQIMKENTKSYQFIKRYYVRKSIQNMTGIRDWRFFENTRNKIDQKKRDIRESIIKKALPESTRSGKVVQCLFGIIECKSQQDPNDPHTHAETPPNGGVCGTGDTACDTKIDEDGDPNTEGNVTNDGSTVTEVANATVDDAAGEAADDALTSFQSKIIKNTLKNLSLATGIVSTLDTLDHLDGVIKSGAIATTIYMARQAQDIGLFSTYGIARDQIHTGQVTDPKEVGAMMQMMNGVGTSEGWNKVIAGNDGSSRASAAAMQPAQSKTDYCSSDHQAAMLQPENAKVAESEYHYMCPSEKIGAATRGSELQDAWNGSIGKLLQPILAPYRASGPLKSFVGFLNNAIDAVVGPVITGVMKGLGLEGTIKDLMRYVISEASSFLGATPTYDQNSPSGVYANHVLSGATASSETAMRFTGGSATTKTSQRDTEQRVLAYDNENLSSEGTFERYLSTANPDSVLSKNLFAATGKPISTSLTSYASSILKSPLGWMSRAKAADSTGYEAANWAEVNTYDLPSACLDSDPLSTLAADALPKQTNADDLGLISSDDLTWELLQDSNAFYAKLYENHPDSKEINNVYDCAAMDSMVRGGTAGAYAPDQAGPNAIANSDTGDTVTDDSDTAGDIVPSTCYIVTKLTGAKIEGRMLHWESGTPINSYAKENSPAGIKYTAEHHKDSIDLDTQITKDGVIVMTHWNAPMVQRSGGGGVPDPFYDPEGKLGKDAKISNMTFAEVSRLRNRDGQSQIYSLEEMAKVLAQYNVNLSLEAKDDSFIKKLPEITGILNKYQVKAYIKGYVPRLNDVLVAARQYGYWTRGTENTQGWKAPSSNCNSGT